MPIETPVSYIDDLVITNPVHTDGLAQADSHIRMIKIALKQSFPNVDGPVTFTPANANNGYVPIGGIIMWSGSVASIPANWQLCNGTNGTADLRDRFILCAGASYAVAAVGGAQSATVATTTDGAHTHSGVTGSDGLHAHSASSSATTIVASSATSTGFVAGTVGNTTLSIAQIPAHDHGLSGFAGIWAQNGPASIATTGTGANTAFQSWPASSQGGGGSHTHTWGGTIDVATSVTSSGSTSVTTSIVAEGLHTHSIGSTGSAHGHSVTVATMPPYFALAFIQRLT